MFGVGVYLVGRRMMSLRVSPFFFLFQQSSLSLPEMFWRDIMPSLG